MDDPLKQVADALNDHQITDETGAIMPETTDVENTTAQEENTVEDTASPEKAAEPTASEPKAEDVATETQLAEDETGKRYVPESRFKEVYGDKKRLERELEAERRSKAQGTYPNLPIDPIQPTQPIQRVDKTAALELELLKTTLPQFNPDAEEYSSELDQLGADIYKSNPGITMVEAGRRAIARAKALTSKQTQIATEARQVKSLQSDQGITSRVKSTGKVAEPDPAKMSLDEKEAWLKENGQW